MNVKFSCLFCHQTNDVSDFHFDLSESLAAIAKYSTHITSAIPDWYQYTYDDPVFDPHSIIDGGNDMFDTGNQVDVKTNEK